MTSAPHPVVAVRRARRAAAAVLLALLVLVAGAATASAHAQLESTDPADGSTVNGAPRSVTLTFNQPIMAVGAAMRVTGPHGSVTDGDPVQRDDTLTQTLRDVHSGDYTVLWRVTSIDGHPIEGRFTFTVTGAPGGPGVGTGTGGDAEASNPVGTGIVVLTMIGGLVVVLVGVWATVLAPRRSGDGGIGEDRTGEGSSGP